MATGYDFDKLKGPFYADEVEWRIQRSGLSHGRPWGFALCYVTNRAIQSRLDSVFGPENWSNQFTSGPNGGLLCGISVRIGKDWVTKWDGADNTDIEEVKGGLSGAMKRAAVQWGIGRYLYELDATFALFSDDGTYTAKIEGKKYKWNPPELPKWALPSELVQANDMDLLIAGLEKHAELGLHMEYSRQVKPKVIRNIYQARFISRFNEIRHEESKLEVQEDVT